MVNYQQLLKQIKMGSNSVETDDEILQFLVLQQEQNRNRFMTVPDFVAAYALNMHYG
jgi:hypothetical protein